MKPLRVLFYKRDIAWPFRSGHDVHTFNMMNALSAAGHQVGLVTVRPLPDDVRESLDVVFHHTLEPEGTTGGDEQVRLPMLQERFRRFWGVSSGHLQIVERLAGQFFADAVVASGLEVLPVLASVRGPLRVWYAADEWVLHHFSQVRVGEPRSWRNVGEAILKGTYERAFCGVVDRVWAVSQADARAFRRLAGMKGVDIIPNGVDAARYQPSAGAEQPKTAVFWGRLDFGPNIQALEWFCSRVWPRVMEHHPDAQFTIIGFHPGDEARRLANLPGVTLCADLADIQTVVHSKAVVVLPFTSGTGIKNKLLEAAAMGKAIVCTSTALSGLSDPPFAGLDQPERWAGELAGLWQDEARRRRRGLQAREWVTRHHTWSSAARKAEQGIGEGLSRLRGER